ncbi:dTDP-4-dehydrorhamnose 3,5-epimerase [Verrucomicrobia bacterium S94]|nr:dTDP-4-dehydrorhamnose 3,5-epimerase [Verrucomicrobia bacterium S94]
MDVIDLKLDGLKLIKPRRFPDERGFFQQNYHFQQYAEAGIETRFVQDNWSRSTVGVLRGLHYQYRNPQAKLVSVIRGEVFDVAVDMRKDSPTFGKWGGVMLSEENGHQLFIPRGFAHGFYVLSDTADFMYKCDAFYAPEDEYGVIWNDPDIGIEWPEGADMIISDKDKMLPGMADARTF